MIKFPHAHSFLNIFITGEWTPFPTQWPLDLLLNLQIIRYLNLRSFCFQFAANSNCKLSDIWISAVFYFNFCDVAKLAIISQEDLAKIWLKTRYESKNF
jgi:hypothetical protein